MSQPRRLWMRFRQVDRGSREAFRDAVVSAGVTAASMGAHFWTFEADGGEGRFVEFLEGPSDSVLEKLSETADASLREAGGGPTVGLHVGAGGLGCTEFT